MPMRTKEEQRAYQLAWIKARRDTWIRENGPCKSCGTWNNLEVDHKDYKTKMFSVSSLWSLSPNNIKRISELAKCQVLCLPCHRQKTLVNNEYTVAGARHGTSKLNEDSVLALKEHRKAGLSYRVLGQIYSISTAQAWNICNNIHWKDL